MLSPSPDAIVIGAGIVGGSIAWRLAQAGMSVTLLDAGELGGEASWAGAGMLAPGGEFTAQTPLARFALESLGLYPAFVQELESEARARIDYRRSGAVELACTEAEWHDLLERRTAQQSLGIRSSARTNVLGAAGALFYPDDAIVDPRDVMRALRYACQARQVRILERTRVLEIRIAAGTVDIETSAGPLSASAAVLTAGAWSGAIPITRTGTGESIAITPTFPVRGHLLGYTLPPGSLGPILRRAHTYLLQRASGFTIAGTSSEQAGFDRRLDPAVIAGIHARACELLPRLRSAPEPQAWLGFRPATANFEPVIRRLDDLPLWLAYGHYRNGILLAPATARLISREITSSSETDPPVPGALR
jgi:glycine oxidase